MDQKSRLRRRGQRVGLVLLWTYTIIRDALDWFGRAALFDDPEHQLNIAQKGLNWLFSTPWQVPTILAVLATALIFFPNIRDFFDDEARSTASKTDLPPETNDQKFGPALSVARDVGVGEAIAFVCFGVWGRTFYDAGSDRTSNPVENKKAFEQAAADDKIQIWGKQAQYGLHEPIDSQFWIYHQLDWFGLLKDKTETEPRLIGVKPGPKFFDLMASRAQVEERWPPERRPSDIAEHVPDVRVADNPEILGLFDGRELIPLLEAEKVTAWGRPMHTGEPPPLKIAGELWRTHTLFFMPKGDDQRRRNQTFFKTKFRQETLFFDVLLNSVQLRRVWPRLKFSVVE